MRARVVGLTLVGLGGCALAVAVLLRVWLAPQPQELALDEDFRTVAVGEVAYLDPVTLRPRTGAEVSVTVDVRGDAASGDADGDTAVWTARSTTSDADGTLVSTTTTVACLDRRTAQARACAAGSVDGRPADVEGLVLAFPPGTGQRDHDIWDGAVGAALPARYAGTEQFRGLVVYRFEQEVPEQVVDSVTVPAALLGLPAGTVPADVVHAGSRTLLVEPVSGVVVSAEERPSTVLRGADGRPGAVLLAGTLRSSEESVADGVARAREVLDRQELLGTVLPWSLGGTGLALAALGALLVARGRPAPAPHVDDEPARVAVPAA
ncbi:DUF3068 domain-containing protein [Blastococcus sp. SYSU D01050]